MTPLQPDNTSKRDPLLNVLSVYSIGTSFAVDAIEHHYSDSTSSIKPNIVAISVATLIRNRLNSDPDILMSKLFDQIKTEMDTLIEDLTAIIHTANIVKPKLVFYLIDYKRSIPKEIQRPTETSKSRALLQKAIEYVFIRENQLLANKHIVLHGVEVLFDTYRMSALPHKHLAMLIKRLSPGPSVMMLSHCPLDYHVSPATREFLLVLSHTGRILPIAEMGKKVFGKETVPFNSLTHAYLGDKDYIKGSLGVKQRRELYALSVKRHWEIRTASTVKKDLRSLKFDVPINFD